MKPHTIYKQKIRQALRELKQERVIVRYEKSDKKSVGASLFYYLTIPYLPRDVLVEFVFGSPMESERSSGFFCVMLSNFPQIVEVRQIKAEIIKEVWIRQKGTFHEKVVLCVLVRLKHLDIIKGLAKTRDRKDIRGADFEVFFFNDAGEYIQMPLQVKSSPTGQGSHIIRFPHIPSICVERATLKKNEWLEEKILRIIASYKKHEVLHL